MNESGRRFIFLLNFIGHHVCATHGWRCGQHKSPMAKGMQPPLLPLPPLLKKLLIRRSLIGAKAEQ